MCGALVHSPPPTTPSTTPPSCTLLQLYNHVLCSLLLHTTVHSPRYPPQDQLSSPPFHTHTPHTHTPTHTHTHTRRNCQILSGMTWSCPISLLSRQGHSADADSHSDGSVDGSRPINSPPSVTVSNARVGSSLGVRKTKRKRRAPVETPSRTA